MDFGWTDSTLAHLTAGAASEPNMQWVRGLKVRDTVTQNTVGQGPEGEGHSRGEAFIIWWIAGGHNLAFCGCLQMGISIFVCLRSAVVGKGPWGTPPGFA